MTKTERFIKKAMNKKTMNKASPLVKRSMNKQVVKKQTKNSQTEHVSCDQVYEFFDEIDKFAKAQKKQEVDDAREAAIEQELQDHEDFLEFIQEERRVYKEMLNSRMLETGEPEFYDPTKFREAMWQGQGISW